MCDMAPHPGLNKPNSPPYAGMIGPLRCVPLHSFTTLKELAIKHKEEMEDKAQAQSSKTGAGKAAPKKKKTVSKAFGTSLNSLMDKLEQTEHRYIRCLKPNHKLQGGIWDEALMEQQLRYSGTLEVCKVRKAGLNVRKPLQTFFHTYKILNGAGDLQGSTIQAQTIQLMDGLASICSQWKVTEPPPPLQGSELTNAPLAAALEAKLATWQSVGSRKPTTGKPMSNASPAFMEFLSTKKREFAKVILTREQMVSFGLANLVDREQYVQVGGLYFVPGALDFSRRDKRRLKIGTVCTNDYIKVEPLCLSPMISSSIDKNQYRVGKTIMFMRDEKLLKVHKQLAHLWLNQDAPQ